MKRCHLKHNTMATGPPVDFARLKILSILEGPGAAVLTFILKSGTNTPSTPVSLWQYLSTLPQTSTANYCKLSNKDKRKAFTNSEKQQISADLSWDKFDVSLLYKVIRIACEHVAQLNDTAGWGDVNSLEGLITKIKDERNLFVHERPHLTQNEIKTKVGKLKNLFMKVLEASQTRYGLSDQEIADEKRLIEKGVKEILKCFTIQEFLRLDSIKMLQVFKSMIVSRLSSMYEKFQIFDPHCFLAVSAQTLVHIQSIFSKVTLKEKLSNADISCFQILGFLQSLGQTTQSAQPTQLSQGTQPTPQSTQSTCPQLLLINGVAGSGKSTLLNFILSEWIKDECDRRIKHLHKYDFVLHVLCRQTNSAGLQEFLEQVLPEATTFRPNTLTLLKKCKVLFLIDGIDERNIASSLLVKDILQQCKEVPGISIMCTSRPEAVIDFLVSAPTEYGTGEVIVEGISLSERTDLVLKYYDTFNVTGCSDHDRVRQVMERIGWRDHFGFPLNLLFLAKLFHYDPDSIRENNTQTSLYVAMQEWCIEKLQYRLTEHSLSRSIDRASREESISRVFEVIGEIALAGVMQERLYLSDGDMRQLKECCTTENLPREEVLGAFFSLRQSGDRLAVQSVYYAPHKGLQEYYAAAYIVNYLVKQSFPSFRSRKSSGASSGTLPKLRRLMTGMPLVVQVFKRGIENKRPSVGSAVEHSSVGGIRRLLQDALQGSIDLKKLRNLLLHVAGLLSQPDKPPLPAVMQEAVDLLSEIGVKEVNDWLAVLEDTEVNSFALECVAKHVRSNNLRDEDVVVTDSTITSAAALLPIIPRKNVEVELHRDVPDVKEFHLVTTGHTCTAVRLWQHYKQPDVQHDSDSVLRVLCRYRLQEFTGRLSSQGIMLLRECLGLKKLRLAVLNDQDTPAVLSAFTDVWPSFHTLNCFWLSVPVKTVTPSLITCPLPDLLNRYGTPLVRLVLSGTDENCVEKTWSIIEALRPRMKGYWAVLFHDTIMNASEWMRLISRMHYAGVRVESSVYISNNNTMTEQEEAELITFAKTRMLGGILRLDKELLWKW